MGCEQVLGIKIELRDSLNDAAIMAVIESVADEYAVAYPGGKPYRPTSANHYVLAWRTAGDFDLVGFIAWDEWNGRAFIGLSWVREGYRRAGVYRAMLRLLTESVRLTTQLKGLCAGVDARNRISVFAHSALMKPEVTLYNIDVERD